MMVIQIPDELSGKSRRRRLNLEPVIYALDNCATRKEAADFLGISYRCLSNIIIRYPELKVYKRPKKLIDHVPPEKMEGYLDMMKRYPDE